MQLHRLAFLFGATSLLLVGAYACGGDDDNGSPSTPDAGAADTGTTTTPDTGTTETPDTGTTEPTDAGDAGDAETDAGLPPGCIGNPLAAADGGTSAVTLDGGQLQTVITGSLLYGPQYIDEFGGQVVYTVFNDHAVVRTSPDGGGITSTLIDLTASPYDLLQSTVWNGNLYTTMAWENATGGGRIYQTPLDGGAAKELMALDGGLASSPNGIAITKNGTIYIADPAFQRNPAVHSGLVRINIDGGAPAIVDPSNPYVGVALNADETRLYISNSNGGLGYYALDANGQTTGSQVTFTKGSRYTPAGIAVDRAGNVWVAEYNGAGTNGAVEVFNPNGTAIWGAILIPNYHATGVAFGGADRTMVFITTEGDTAPLYKMATRCPGLL